MTWCNRFIGRNLPNSSWGRIKHSQPSRDQGQGQSRVPSDMLCFQAGFALGNIPSLSSSGVPLPPHAPPSLDMLVFPGGCSAPTVFTSSNCLKDNSVLMTPQVCLLSTGLSPKLPAYTCTCVWEVSLGNPTGTSDSCPLMILLH